MDIITLDNIEASREFNINLEDGAFSLKIMWNSITGAWILNIAKDNITVIDGVQMILGTDLVRGFNLGIGIWFMDDLTNRGFDATRQNLGTDIILRYIPESERGLINA